MASLNTTYEVLTHSATHQAFVVLRKGLDCDDETTRRRCVLAMARRTNSEAHDVLVDLWEDLQVDIKASLADPDSGELVDGTTAFAQRILTKLAKSHPNDQVTWSLIEMAEAFLLYEAILPLIDITEKHPSAAVRERASEAMMDLIQPLGKRSRIIDPSVSRDPAEERLRVQMSERLFRCVKSYQNHRNTDLIDAFLVISTWNDPAIRTALDDHSEYQGLLLRQLRSSRLRGVLELLAGFIRRRNIPGRVLGLLLHRSDGMFCETLLDIITSKPATTTLGNMKEYGLPDCLRGGEPFLSTLGLDRGAPLVQVYSVAMKHDPETLALIMAVIRRGGKGSMVASEHSLNRCEVPSLDYWLTAMDSPLLDLSFVDGRLRDDSEIDSNDPSAGMEPADLNDLDHADRAAMILHGLMELLEREEAPLRRQSARLLYELNVQSVLPRFSGLTDEAKQRLGRVLMRIDPSTIDVVRDGLRHAVMQRRVDAIEFAEALGLVDLMIQPLQQIASSDHQIARLRTAKALAAGVSEASENILRELATSPQESLRDAAIASLQTRGVVLS